MKALVLFKDSTWHPLHFLLKENFKHCFVCVNTGQFWVEVNLIKNVTQIHVVATADYDVEDFYRQSGHIVVSTSQRVMRPSIFNLFYGTFLIANCVGLVKSILGINTFSWTPYSLYKELKK